MILPTVPPWSSRYSRYARRFVFATPLAWGLASGCSSGAGSSGGALCTYGETLACLGESGCGGERVCLPDLTGYSDCLCHPADGSADGSEDAASGSDGGAEAP